MGHQPELQIEQRKLLDLHLELVLKENERSTLPVLLTGSKDSYSTLKTLW